MIHRNHSICSLKKVAYKRNLLHWEGDNYVMLKKTVLVCFPYSIKWIQREYKCVYSVYRCKYLLLCLWLLRLIGPGDTWFKLRRKSLNPAWAPTPSFSTTRNPTPYRWVIRPPYSILLDQFGLLTQYIVFVWNGFLMSLNHQTMSLVKTQPSSVWDLTSRWSEQGGRWRSSHPKGGRQVALGLSLSWWVTE